MNYENYCQVLGHIERNPQEWRQSAPCYGDGRPCCLFGHAKRSSPFAGFAGCFAPGRRFLEVRYEYELAEWLFDAGRTLDDFRRIRLVAGRGNFPRT